MCTGTPVIVWGDNLDKSLALTYPLYDWVTRSEALDGSQFLRIESGYEDSWIVNTSYVLEGTVAFIKDDNTSYGWDDPVYGWQAFLEWAQQKNEFLWFPDAISPAILSYLVEPITQAPTIEPDGTRTIRLVIRNSTTPYDIGTYQNTDPDPINVGTYPTGGLVLFLNNSVSSYPGTGNTWYDVSGNGIDYILSGSPSFSMSTGFDFNGTTQFATSGISSSLATFWPSGSKVTSSMAVIIACTPDVLESANIFGQWDGPYATDAQRFKFNTDMNNDGTIEASTYSNTGTVNNFVNDFTTTTLFTTKENIIMWHITGSLFQAYNNLGFMNDGALQPTGSRWFGADPESVIAAGRNSSGVYGSFFDGKIRAIMVYNRPLTTIERSQIYNYLKYTI